MKVNMGQPNDLLLDDLELLLREIEEFNTASSNNKPTDIPHTLDNYLQFVAKSGNTVFPWPHVRSLFRAKIISAIQQFQEPTCTNENFVLERFDMFRIAAPFTVQRLTELILQPTRHYRKKEKFLRGLEKTVLVVSTIEPRSLTGDEEKNGSENDVHNVSASSGEGETETVAFNLFHCVAQERENPNLATPLQPKNATAVGQLLEQRDISLDTGDSEVELIDVSTSLVNIDKSVTPEPTELLESTMNSAPTLEIPATNLEETPPVPLQPIDDPANSNVESVELVEESPVDPSIELAVSSVSNLATPLQPTNATADDQLLEQRDISLDTRVTEVELKDVSTSLVNIDISVNPEPSELLESSLNSAVTLEVQGAILKETSPVHLEPSDDPANSNVQQCAVEESPVVDPSIELAVSSVSHLTTPLQSTDATADGQLLEQRDINISLDTGDSEVELKDVSTSLVNMNKSQNAEPSELLESSIDSAAALEIQATNLEETPPAPLQPIDDPAANSKNVVSVELVEESPVDPAIESAVSSVSLTDSIEVEVEAKTNLFHDVD